MASSTKNISTEFIAQSIFRMQENVPRIQKCLDLLTEEQVWEKPNSSTNSIANLILHLCGNIRQYINSSLGNQPDLRQRDNEFSVTDGLTKKELFSCIESTVNKAISVLENLTEDELLKERSVQGFQFSGIGNVIHVVEHFSYHTGQIAIQTKLLANKDLGFYADMDLNLKNE